MLRWHTDINRLKTPPSVETAEITLIGRIATGELCAFDALYRVYHPRLQRFLERLTRRPAMVDELLNDTLLVVWHSASRFNGQSKVSTWIFAIAYRKAMKALRQLDEPLESEATDYREAPTPGPEQLASHQQLHAALTRAIDCLSPEHRAVVDLTYFHGLSYGEIAAIADCPVDTVKTRMFYARRKLKTLLAGGLEDWL